MLWLSDKKEIIKMLCSKLKLNPSQADILIGALRVKKLTLICHMLSCLQQAEN